MNRARAVPTMGAPHKPPTAYIRTSGLPLEGSSWAMTSSLIPAETGTSVPGKVERSNVPVYGTLTPPSSYDYKKDPQPAGYASDHYPVVIDLIPKDQ